MGRSVDEIRDRAAKAEGNADALIALIEDAFEEIAVEGAEASNDMVRDLMQSTDPASAGSIIREALAKDREHGREGDDAYMRLVHLSSSEGALR